MSKLTQEQKLEQSFNLSPAQIQAIRLLELTALELDSRIERELEDNPALEEGVEQLLGEEPDQDDDNEQDWELGDYATEDDIPAYKLKELQERQSQHEEIPFAASAPTIDDILLEQLRMDGLSDLEDEVARYIIGNISAEGYLERTVEELQDDLLFKSDIEVDAEIIAHLIGRIRKLEPAGIAARDLQDCLLLQLERRSPADDQVSMAIRLLQMHYDDFVYKRFDRLAEQLQITRDQLADLYKMIGHLNPKPSEGFDSSEDARMMHYNPDFVVHELDDGSLSVSLVGERDIRPLRISAIYQDMLMGEAKSRSAREAREFAKYKVEQARNFIDSLSMRQDTLKRTMIAIVAYQEAFFRGGEINDLRPMILRDIAEITGLDLSTISRVSNSKSVQTDYGVYPLKFFFGDGQVISDGNEVSTRAIKQELSDLIDGENKQSPYTDEELAQIMTDKGYKLMRRTIAKYREQLRIPTARLRRQVK